MKNIAIGTFITAFFILHLSALSCLASNPVLLARNDITELSLEELMDITVTSVSKKESKLSESAAAIYVITQDDIRRSGVTNIPEALRMAPGIQVARINSNIWAITSRGFNDRFTNKLLVLIDGRTIYTPLFAGVYWDRQDILLEDVERIEVIRGPGAALWGANAVNGIINIITKNSKDTQGGLVTAGGGTEERGFGSMRFGGEAWDKVYYRGYIKYFDRDDFTSASVPNTMDEWNNLQGGFRVDGDITEGNSITLQGDVYHKKGGDLETVAAPYPPFSEQMYVPTSDYGANILGRWKHTISNTSDMSLQLYYDYVKGSSAFFDRFETPVSTYDIDFQHRFRLSAAQDLIWGLGFRMVSDDIKSSSNLIIDPQSRATPLYSAFLQDEITLVPDRLKLIIGSKFEHNYYSKFEVQPNGRVLWTPHERHDLWASISRAVVTPSRTRFDTQPFYANATPPDALYTGSPAIMAVIWGNRNLVPEELMAYEAGYRFRPTDQFSIDIASFYNDYDKLQTFEIGAPYLDGSASAPFLGIPVTLDNKMRGETYGMELAAKWLATNWMRFKASYSYIQMHMHLAPGSTDASSEGLEGSTPKHQFSIAPSIDLPQDMELDGALRYVGRLPSSNIDGYVEMDLRLGWEPIKNLEISLVGQNLFDNSHSEFTGPLFGLPQTEVQRGVYGKVRWEF